jgi:hypothetical protein
MSFLAVERDSQEAHMETESLGMIMRSRMSKSGRERRGAASHGKISCLQGKAPFGTPGRMQHLCTCDASSSDSWSTRCAAAALDDTPPTPCTCRKECQVNLLVSKHAPEFKNLHDPRPQRDCCSFDSSWNRRISLFEAFISHTLHVTYIYMFEAPLFHVM